MAEEKSEKALNVWSIRWTPDEQDDMKETILWPWNAYAEANNEMPAWEHYRRKFQECIDHWKEEDSRWIYQLEKGNNANKYHFQCYFKCRENDKNKGGRRMKSFFTKYMRNTMKMNDCDVSPCSSNGMDQLKAYCMKTEDSTFVHGPWMDEKGKELRSMEYKGEDLPSEWRPWQQGLLNMVKNKPDNNGTVIWFTDQQGGGGKTAVTKHLKWKHGAVRFGWMKAHDMAFRAVKQGPRKIYIFDFTRAKGVDFHDNDIYMTLEELSNGMLDSGKYEGGSLLMNPPWVIVFANFPPLDGALSQGRLVSLQVPQDKAYVRPDRSQQIMGLLGPASGITLGGYTPKATKRKPLDEEDKKRIAKRQKLAKDQLEEIRNEMQGNKPESTEDRMEADESDSLI